MRRSGHGGEIVQQKSDAPEVPDTCRGRGSLGAHSRRSGHHAGEAQPREASPKIGRKESEPPAHRWWPSAYAACASAPDPGKTQDGPDGIVLHRREAAPIRSASHGVTDVYTPRDPSSSRKPHSPPSSGRQTGEPHPNPPYPARDLSPTILRRGGSRHVRDPSSVPEWTAKDVSARTRTRDGPTRRAILHGSCHPIGMLDRNR